MKRVNRSSVLFLLLPLAGFGGRIPRCRGRGHWRRRQGGCSKEACQATCGCKCSSSKPTYATAASLMPFPLRIKRP